MKPGLLIVTQTVNQEDSVLGAFVEWIREFSQHYERVTVLALNVGVYDLPDNVEVIHLGKHNQYSRWQDRLRYIGLFYRYIWKYRHVYQDVFVHMNQIYAILGWPCWRMWGKKIGLWYMHRSVTWSLRMAVGMVDYIFTGTKNSFRIKSPKVMVTGHGVPKSRFNTIGRQAVFSNEKIVCMTSSRISKTKYVQESVMATIMLHKQGLPISMEVCGGAVTQEDELYMQELKDIISKHDAREYITLHGPVNQEQIAALLKTSDISINMSGTGSLDKSLVEAAMSGCLLVSSSDSFFDFVSSDLARNYYVPEHNAQALADKIAEIISQDLHQKRQFCDHTQQSAEQHSLDSLINRIVLYFDD